MRTLTTTDRADAQRVAGSTPDLGGIHPAMLPFVQWFAPVPARRPKQGHAADRKAVADFIRAQRARLPELKGDWTLWSWSVQVHIAGRNKLAQMTARRKLEVQDDYHTGHGPTYRAFREAEMQGSGWPK